MLRTTPARRTRPIRPAGLAHGRWLGDLEPPLNPAERKLLADSAAGVDCILGSQRPQERPEHPIRAELLRFLVLGGDELHPVAVRGVQLAGAWIEGTLDLDSVHGDAYLFLRHCHFAGEAFTIQAAKLGGLDLQGSKLAGLVATELETAGQVALNGGFESTGQVGLSNATLGSGLDCANGTFSAPGEMCLDLGGIRIGGDATLLRSTFVGQIRLTGARIGGNLYLDNAAVTFAKPAVDPHAPETDASSEIQDIAIAAYRAGIDGDLFIRNAAIAGGIDLTAARCGMMIDEASSWANGGHLFDGFCYDRIKGDIDVSTRLAWLRSQQGDQLGAADFSPQPWERLSKVLRDMGFAHEASEIAIAKQDALRAAGKIEWPRAHAFFGAIAGYGYRPQRIIKLLGVLWLASTIAFYAARHEGYFAPANDTLVKANEAICGAPGDLAKAKPPLKPVPKRNWDDPACTPREYGRMQPAVYALDLILPVVDLQQRGGWHPIIAREDGTTLWWGVALRLWIWALILCGWVGAGVLVSVLGGLVRKD